MIKEIENQWCAKLERTFSQDPKKYRELTEKLVAVDADLECRKHNDVLQARSKNNGYLLSISSDSFHCSCKSFQYGKGSPCKHLIVLVMRYQRARCS